MFSSKHVASSKISIEHLAIRNVLPAPQCLYYTYKLSRTMFINQYSYDFIVKITAKKHYVIEH